MGGGISGLIGTIFSVSDRLLRLFKITLFSYNILFAIGGATNLGGGIIPTNILFYKMSQSSGKRNSGGSLHHLDGTMTLVFLPP